MGQRRLQRKLRRYKMRRRKKRAKNDEKSFWNQPRFKTAASLILNNQPEYKCCDVLVQTTPFYQSGFGNTIFLLNGVQQGYRGYERVGRKITMKSLEFVGRIYIDADQDPVEDEHEYDRILIVYDRQTNGGKPHITEILLMQDNTGNNQLGSHTSMAYYNCANERRFDILYDSRFSSPWPKGTNFNNDVSAITTYDNKAHIDLKLDLEDRETYFWSSTNPASVADISAGSLLLVLYGNLPGLENRFELKWQARLRYTDTPWFSPYRKEEYWDNSHLLQPRNPYPVQPGHSKPTTRARRVMKKLGPTTKKIMGRKNWKRAEEIVEAVSKGVELGYDIVG